ncbi:MAG: Gfo/Idh/MocA family oxidoreductase, partial [Proteobacteria bacterium]|nr:Gfo/Idh/MocA family oxidoreductase [Pseudomonadota bacterium]
KVLIVGLGQVGMGYDLDSNSSISSHAKSFSSHSKFKLIGGVDKDLSRRKLFEENYRLPSYSKVSEAVLDETPDVVVIAVATEFHFSIFTEVINSCSPRAILCEKPLSYFYDEANKIVTQSEKRGIQLYTNYLRRCDNAIIDIKKRIHKNKIITPFKGICWYTKGLIHNGSHFINLFQFLFGDVKSFEIINPGRQLNSSDIEADVKIRFGSGDIYFLSIPEENFSHCAFEMIFENGQLRYEHGVMSWNSVVADKIVAGYKVINETPEIIDSDTSRLQWHVVDQLSRSLAGENSHICNGKAGLSTQYVLEKIRSDVKDISRIDN